MIVVAACFPIEAWWMRRRRSVHVVRVPMGARAPEGLPELGGGDEPRLLVSAGFSGGLTDAGRTGDVVLAETIEHDGERIAIDARLLQRARDLLRGVGRVTIGPTS